jgi:hypothetical protein
MMEPIMSKSSGMRYKYVSGRLPQIGAIVMNLTENLETGSWEWDARIALSKKPAGPASEQFLMQTALGSLHKLFENLTQEGHLIEPKQLSFTEIWDNGGTV